MAVDRTKLAGTYETPRFKVGDIVPCALRGYMKIVGVTEGRIPWPMGKRIEGRQNATPAIILYDGLIEAVRNESSVAVIHWWGVTSQTVTVWRKTLGVGRITAGTSALYAEQFRDHVGELMRPARIRSLASPERRAKISAAKLGKPRPDVSERNRSRRGVTLSSESRRRMSEAWQRHGFVGGKKGAKAWTEAEDELVRTLPTTEAAARTGRTIASIYCRRRKLKQAAMN